MGTTGMLILMFCLGGLLGAGIEVVIYIKEKRKLTAEIKAWEVSSEEWQKRFRETNKELQTFKLMPVPTVTVYQSETIPLECEIPIDMQDFNRVPYEWLENEIAQQLLKGIKPYISIDMTDDFYRMKKIVRGRVRVVNE